MKTLDLLELAMRNVRESRLRNALTAMGISVGVASLVSMLSLGVGLQNLATAGIARSGLLDTLTVTSQANGRGGNGPQRETAAVENARILDLSARQEMERLPGVREVYPNLSFTPDIRLGEETATHRATVAGSPISARESEAFRDIQGSFFSSLRAPEIILDKSFAAELAGDTTRKASAAELAKQLTGKKISITYAQRTITSGSEFSVSPQTKVLKIVGIQAREAGGGGGRGPGGPGGGPARGFVPLEYAEDLRVMQPSDLRNGGLSLGTPEYASLTVRLKNPSDAAVTDAAIKKMGFNTFSAIDATSTLRQVFAVIDLFLGAFGSLALAVASIGIVNTLVMAILERRREIGIMKALGASDTDVRKIFLAEAAVLGMAGGVFGVAIGWAIGRIINFGANIFIERQGLPAQQIWFVPLWLVGGALIFSLVASLLSGWYPAARAARLDPATALRHD